MEQSTRDFLIWIEAFCENVEGIPSEKQWNRVLEKIKDMAEAARSEPVAAQREVDDRSPVASVPVVPPPTLIANNAQPVDSIVTPVPVTRTTWMAQYKMRLKELGLTDESDLNDFVKLATYNDRLDPRKQATHDFNSWFPGTNAA